MHILLVEDDTELGVDLSHSLKINGHDVCHEADGVAGLARLCDTHFDVAVVDRMLPVLGGLDLVRKARKGGNRTPVLFLTTLDGVYDRVEGLDAGGDDYLTKPFAMPELLARLRALVRRGPVDGSIVHRQLLDLELDRIARTATRAGKSIMLQQREFDLLDYLLHHAGDVVTRAMLLRDVWGLSFDPGTNVVESHISRMRAKVDRGFAVQLIHTLRGTGYIARAPD